MPKSSNIQPVSARRGAAGLFGGLALMLAACLAVPAGAIEGDPEGSGDHPLIPRYAGAAIIGYDHRAFERFVLPLGPQQRDAEGNVVLAESVTLEGRHTRIIYAAPPERSTLEVFGNYERALAEAGFEILFVCEANGCGERGLLVTHVLYAPDQRLRTLGPVTEFAFSFPLQPYYIAARLPREDGDVHVSLYVARENFDAFPETQNHALVLLDVIEPGTMEDLIDADGETTSVGLDAPASEPVATPGAAAQTGAENGPDATSGTATEIAVAVDAPAASVAPDRPVDARDAASIERALRSDGRVAVYGVEFASGSADLTEASYGVIGEIASVLGRNPGLTLFVVGHTDSDGSYQFNLALSQRRAEAVVRVLVERELIAADRLTAEGIGMLAPVASNATEEGRALNRRVELVVR